MLGAVPRSGCADGTAAAAAGRNSIGAEGNAAPGRRGCLPIAKQGYLRAKRDTPAAGSQRLTQSHQGMYGSGLCFFKGPTCCRERGFDDEVLRNTKRRDNGQRGGGPSGVMFAVMLACPGNHGGAALAGRESFTEAG